MNAPASPPTARLCVIGAGAAGISALQQLRAAGHAVECFEKTDRVGGHWNTDYDALHLITSRDMTHFEDFPMPRDYPHFPRRDLVRSYIQSYARHHGHDDLIHFETPIVAVTPVPVAAGAPTGSAGWQVRSSRGDEGVFDAVLVANGHLWDPFIPSVPGEFTGGQHHSSSYRNVADLTGERVLVVGSGNSGCDLAVDVAQHRLDCDVSVRRAPHFQPKMYFGRPRAEVEFLQEFGPRDQDLIARLLARVSIGRNSDYPGLPEPEAETLADSSTTVNDLLLYWIHHGRIGVKPGLARFEGSTVHFTDGSSGDYDHILWATGFNVRLPFLADDVITWRDGVPLRYAGGILPDGAENLFFVGLTAPRGPQIPIYGQQAKVIAQMLDMARSGGVARRGLSAYFARLQEPDTRIDLPRDQWLAQCHDTQRLLAALQIAGQAAADVTDDATGAAGSVPLASHSDRELATAGRAAGVEA